MPTKIIKNLEKLFCFCSNEMQLVAFGEQNKMKGTIIIINCNGWREGYIYEENMDSYIAGDGDRKSGAA